MNATAKRNRYDSYRIVFSAILVSIIFVCQIMDIDRIVSLCFAASIAIVVISYVGDVLASQRVSLDIIFLLILMLFSFIWDGIKLDFGIYKRAIIFLCCIICLCRKNDFVLSIKQIKIIELSFTIAVGYAVYMYYLGGLDKSYYGTTELVALNFSNPNECSMWLVTFFIGMILLACIEKSKLLKLVMLTLSVMLFPIIDATGSRNSLLASILFVVSLILLKIFSLKKVPRLIMILLTILPVIVFFLYMYIIIPYEKLFAEIFSFMIEEGKDLTSREDVWQLVVDDMRECFMFGRYNYYQGEQMHNSLMTVFCMFGAGVTGLICKMFYNSLKSQNNLAQVCLLAIWFTGCFEASFFVGIAGMYLMLEILPVLADSNINVSKLHAIGIKSI